MIRRALRFFTPKGWLAIAAALTLAAFVGTCMGLADVRERQSLYVEDIQR